MITSFLADTSRDSKTAWYIVTGGVVGGVLLLIVVLAVAYFVLSSLRKKESKEEVGTPNFQMNPVPISDLA